MNNFAGSTDPDTFAEVPLSSDTDAQEPDAPQDGSKPTQNPRFQKRIDQLTARNRELERQLSQQSQQVQGIQSQVAAIDSRLSSTSDGSLKDWKDLSVGEIQKLLIEQGSTDPTLQARAITEIARRQATEATKDIESRYRAERTQEKLVQQTWNNIRAEYPEASDNTSPLFKLADQIAQNYQQQHGADILDRRPDLIELAFAKAAANVYRSAARGLRSENEKFKASDKERAGNEADLTRRNVQRASMRKLLANGNVKAAAATVMARLHGLKPPESQE